MPNEQPLDDKFVNVMRFTFGIIILLMMAGLVLGLFFLQIPDGNDNPLVQLVGTIGTLAGMVIGYCFASTISSHQKNKMLSSAINSKPVATGKSDDPIYVEPQNSDDTN